MVSIQDVESSKLIVNVSSDLESKIKMHDGARYVKTGVSRERPPENKDWWHMRAASIMRRLYLDGPVGVMRLRTRYGGLKDNGHQPSHFARGGGKVLRVILQDLEKAGLVAQDKKGRTLTKD